MKVSRITLEDVYKDFAQINESLHVLKGINAHFERGRSYAITGVSGTGKSTLIHIIAGIDTPSSGRVLYGKRDGGQLSSPERMQLLNEQIGLVFQEAYLLNDLTVIENVMLKGLIAGGESSALRLQAQLLLERVGLAAKADVYPPVLSGGQVQRVALARAIFNKPSFLIADEPTGNLDVQTGQDMIDLIMSMADAVGMGVIISSHDTYVAEQMQTTLTLKEGGLVVASKK